MNHNSTHDSSTIIQPFADKKDLAPFDDPAAGYTVRCRITPENVTLPVDDTQRNSRLESGKGFCGRLRDHLSR